MEILQFCITILNMVLYYALLMAEMIFNAFGLTWLGVVTGLAVTSVLFRLFAANLVGTSLGGFAPGGLSKQAVRKKWNSDTTVRRAALPSGDSNKLRKG